MFDINKIEINAAFYELFESRATEMIKEKDENGETVERPKENLALLSEDEQKEVMEWKLRAGLKAKKYTSRIAYIGSLLFKKKYNGSLEDYYMWLSSFDASTFNDPKVTQQIWEKVNKDQKVPDSAKNG